MNKHLEYYANRTLKQLETLQEQIRKTDGNLEKSKHIRLLSELLKEQGTNENTGHTTRAPR